MSARPTAPPPAWRRRPFRSAVTALVTTSVVALGSIVAAPAAMAAESTIDDAVFTWGINNESNNSAFQPGAINLLSAGEIAKTSGADTVVESEWKQTDGNVAIQKKQADGTWAPSTWAGLRTTATGGPITPPSSASYSDNRVAISGGTGTVDVEAGTAEIQWDGTFTAAYYQGLTQFSASDPKLTVDADGTGVVTATLSGYGTSMDDPNLFVVLEPQADVVIATLSGVDVTDTGFTVTPDYLGTVVSVPESGVPQSTTGANAGSFPQSFVDFQVLTGMASYWYSSGGAADAAKPTTPLGVSYTVAPVVPEVVPATITKQPAGVTVEGAGKATFTVEAAGDGPLSYRWELSEDGGATWTAQSTDAPTLTLAFQASQTGALVRVTVDNAAGQPVVSESALVTVLDPAAQIDVSNASLEWAYSRYAQTGVFGAWSQNATGEHVELLQRDGKAVSGLDADAGKTFTLAQFTGGTGRIDPATGFGQIAWETGDWVLNAYQGQFGAPNETFRDPILTTAPDGTGTLSFEVFIPAGKDMGGNAVPAVGPTRIDLATYSSVSIVDGVLVAVPDYAGRDYVVDGAVKNVGCETPGVSGSWPSAYIDFVPSSVRAHYYTTSCTGLNLMKPPLSFSVELQPVVQVAPAITAQPSDVVAPIAPATGSPVASFAVTATGSPEPTVVWERRAAGGDWVAIEGATAATLTLPYSAADDATEVRATVSNAAGSATSEAATLTVGAPASITAQPSAASVKVGETATFTVGIAGDAAAVQWQRLAAGATGWTDVAGATGTSLEIVTTAQDAGAQYRAVVTGAIPTEIDGSVFSVTSAPVGLAVDTTIPVAAAIVSQPASVTAPVGAASPSVFFSVGVTGTPAPSVQWFERAVGADGWSAITGATSATLEVDYADGDSGKRFRAVVGNGVGDPITSDVATLTLGVPASITTQPASVSVAHGEDAVFAVVTAGDDVAVQWQHLALGSTGWVDLDGATSAELTIASADVRNGEQVRAVVSNDIPSAPGASGGSTVTSAAASVTLTVPSTVPTAPDAASLAEAPGIDITGIDGDVITVSVGTQYAGQYLGAYAFSEPQWLGWALVAADGTVSFTVPSDLEAGDHTLAVLDADGVLIGTAAFTVTVTVVTNPDGTTTTTTAVLASTGADAAVPFLAGGLLLAAGLVLALLARRRKTQVAAV
ncbi:hypothetical protein HOW07_19045 [Plantibacter sp. MCCC 1A11337]|uniref:hypothetical protein n=1 Tax=Plantibacter sp. MCCC 1A11337 TaxID=2736644 RepID=UPI00158202A2|nr:hypothetical protein [Plantibacter sp. MCCC 1A11337]NUJ90118.1 hypothetical protein [Plantibacter sp. MCCC 1A11337]